MRAHIRTILFGAVASCFGSCLLGQTCLAAAAAPPNGDTARITTIMQRLREVRHFGSVAVAPDGKLVAWTVTQKNIDKTKPSDKESLPAEILQIADADGTQVRTVTIPDTVKSCRYNDLQWSPNGRTLAFLSNCNHSKKDEQQLDIYEVGGTETQARRMTHLHGVVHELAWTPDGTGLSFLFVKGDLHPISAVSATKPGVGVIGVTGVENQQVALVAANDGAVQEITPVSIFVYEYDWSPAGHELAYIGAPPPGRDNWWVAKLYTQRVGSLPVVTLDPATVSGPLHGLQIALPRWSPDGSRIAFIGGLMSDQGSTGGDIYIVSASGGRPIDITPGINISPSWLTWTGNQNLLVSSFAGGSTRISNFTLRRDLPATEQSLFTIASGVGDGSFDSALSVSARHDMLVFIDSSFDQPPEVGTAILKINAADQPVGVVESPHTITRVNEGTKPMWGKFVSLQWRNEGFKVQGWLLFPPNFNSHKRYPLIVYVHGGPSAAVRPSWPWDGYGPVPLAAMGYFVLMPNPRGSFGEGERFTQAVRLNMGYADLRDILAGVDKVETKYPIDDQRLGLTGWSYGGFMSMFAPTQTHRFKAAVVGAGLSDWESYYGENSIDQWMIPFFGASVYDDPQAYAKSSAINFIKNDQTPALIVVGEYDGECPAPQSFEYWHALRAMGVPTELVVYADEGHGFHKPKDRRDVLERALRWFDHYLGSTAVAGAKTAG